MASVYKNISKRRGQDSDDESSGDEAATNQNNTSSSTLPPRTRVLMLTSRGVTHRHRHFLNDLHSLLPHTYKDTKLDTKSSNNYNSALNGLASLHSCNLIFFLEARKHGQDLYLWLSRAPNGPTIKFNVDNIHTMGELGFSGNVLKGGRGIVVFDPSFEGLGPGEEWRGLIREMMRGLFSVPKRGGKGVKPFIDRVIGIFGVDGKVWIRVYEIREEDKDKKDVVEALEEAADAEKGVPDVSLVEVGPRFVLTPILVQEGSFGGPIIYENKQYVSPNQVRREVRMKKATKYNKKKDGVVDRVNKRTTMGLASGEMARKKGDLDAAVLFS